MDFIKMEDMSIISKVGTLKLNERRYVEQNFNNNLFPFFSIVFNGWVSGQCHHSCIYGPSISFSLKFFVPVENVLRYIKMHLYVSFSCCFPMKLLGMFSEYPLFFLIPIMVLRSVFNCDSDKGRYKNRWIIDLLTKYHLFLMRVMSRNQILRKIYFLMTTFNEIRKIMNPSTCSCEIGTYLYKNSMWLFPSLKLIVLYTILDEDIGKKKELVKPPLQNHYFGSENCDHGDNSFLSDLSLKLIIIHF